jgi:hypothetical protein
MILAKYFKFVCNDFLTPEGDFSLNKSANQNPIQATAA